MEGRGLGEPSRASSHMEGLNAHGEDRGLCFDHTWHICRPGKVLAGGEAEVGESCLRSQERYVLIQNCEII